MYEIYNNMSSLFYPHNVVNECKANDRSKRDQKKRDKIPEKINSFRERTKSYLIFFLR